MLVGESGDGDTECGGDDGDDAASDSAKNEDDLRCDSGNHYR